MSPKMSFWKYALDGGSLIFTDEEKEYFYPLN
jgi:hypothetical protein